MLLWLNECEQVIHLRSNVGRLVEYVTKDFYPRGVGMVGFRVSLKIGRLLEGNGSDEQTRQSTLSSSTIFNTL